MRLMSRSQPTTCRAPGACHFPGQCGTVWLDSEHCEDSAASFIVEQVAGLLASNDDGKPTLAVDAEEIAKKDSELIALEVGCRRAGHPLVFVDLAISGLDDDQLSAA